MAKKDIKFTLDTIDSRYSPVGTVKQLDSVFFYIKITENGVTKDLTGQTIKLFAIKEDKKIVEQTTKINITNQSEGLVEIELLNAAIQVHGFTYFELEISDSNGIISTADFILRVNKRVGSPEAIESTNEVSTLKEIEVYVAQAKQEIKEFKALQNEMLKVNNTINTQEALRKEAEDERIQAEKSRIEAEKKREETLNEFYEDFAKLKDNVENLFNKDDVEIEKGKFINVNGGISSAAGYNISGFIEVEEHQAYIYKFNSSQFGNNSTYLYYRENGDLLGYAKGVISEKGLTCSLIAPVGAKKIKINFMEIDRNSLMFVKGDAYPNSYESFDNIKFSENIGLNDKQKDEVRGLGSDNPLSGKVIALNGDSICYGAGFKGGYGKIIADRNNMIYENIAVSGGTIATNTTDTNTGKNRHWISSTISNMREDADYVVLEGGVNDASSHVAIGEITTGYSSPLDNTTFCGALESTLKQALERFPGKKIGFIIVHKMCSEFNSSEGENYYHKAIQILEKWGVPYLDLNTKCPPLNYIPNLKKTYTHNGDGWHPNEEGYKKYYCDKIESFLISL